MHPPQTPAASLPGILLCGIIVSAQIGRSLSGPVPSDSPTPSPENPADLLLPPALQIIGRLGLDAARRQDATAGFSTEPSLSSSTFPSSTPTVSATPSPSPTDTVGEVRHVSSPVAMIAGSLAGFIVILAAVLVAVVARRHKHNELRTRGGRGAGTGAGAGRRPSRRGTRRSARGGYRGDGDDPRTPEQLLSAAPLQRKKTKTYSYAPYELGEDPPDVDGDGLGDGEDAYDIELHERASKHHHPPASYPHPRSRPLGDGKDSSSSSFPSPGDSRPSPEILSPPSEPLPLPLQRALPPPLHPSGVGVVNALLLDDPEDLPPAYPGVR